ncbi:MAG: hypothetical protein CMP23_16710 [Rickettsiales bacterium]|nr:hypothetical protein [Rickettsiales bacterium]|tara:strand:- start:57 stop:2825 length:2769 start_codon:yes stop_codon:yes gene_type:complete
MGFSLMSARQWPSRLALLLVMVVGLSGCGEPLFHPADRVDADGDGYYAIASGTEISLPPSELQRLRLDCDDDNDNTFPQAAELCDGEDNDCDLSPEDDEDDADGDGYTECGYSPDADKDGKQDCNDNDSTIHPERPEVCDGKDNDCDGFAVAGADGEAELWPGDEEDSDEDGYLRCADFAGDGDDFLGGGDCSDDKARDPQADLTNPGVSDPQCSDFLRSVGLGTDCADYDGGLTVWRPDRDRDLDTDPNQGNWLETCGVQPPDFSIREADGRPNYLQVLPGVAPSEDYNSDDCDDNRPLFNSHDNDQDGFTTCGDDGVADQTADGDLRFGGVVSADDNASIFPGATEICDREDNDLDGLVDEDFDSDGDGAVDGTNSECVAAYAGIPLDCNDGNENDNQSDLDNDGWTTCGPDGVANSGDEDCNDGNSLLNRDDVDGDGYDSCGDPNASGGPQLADCDDFNASLNRDDVDGDNFDTCGSIAQAPDCNDSDPLVYPAAPPSCSNTSTDDDCNGAVDPTNLDLDGDGYSNCTNDCNDQDASLNVDDVDGDGFTSCEGDCDDGQATVFPGAPIVCDNISDNDCNGAIDLNERDFDNDGDSPCDGDCDDFDNSLNSQDGDGDGVSTCAGDCDDSNSALSPNVDNDGDGWDTCGGPGLPADCDDSQANLNWSDIDGDDASTCSSPADCDDLDDSLSQADDDSDGTTSCDGDCDDNNSNVGSGDLDVRDGLDNDCDGTADEGVMLSGAIAVVEMMIAVDPSNNDGVGEYIELFNSLATPVDLRGWLVEVQNGATGLSEQFSFPQGLDVEPIVVPPSSLAVFARANNIQAYNTDITQSSPVGYVWNPPLFSNSSGSITFRFGSVTVDTVSWGGSSTSAWGEGVAMAMPTPLNASTDDLNDSASVNWCAETASIGGGNQGTPGSSPSCN